MTKTFKVLGALLTYPTEDIQAAAPEFVSVLDAEGLLNSRQLTRLGRLIHQLAKRDLYDLQERYIQLFDRSKTLSLHLFEHVHGEGRDRGQAMVDLQALYARHGLEISARELPDFLPLFLEFLSVLPLDEARQLLGEPGHVLDALRERLRKRDSIYVAVFEALVALGDGEAAAELADIKTQEEDPDDLEALDKEWEDEPVTFGPGEEGCPIADDMVAQMNAPASSSNSQGVGQ